MPKEESDSTNRTNPYITKSISKTLLTPCRQVGLSRKRKTPNSCTSSFSKNETSSVTSKVASFEDKSGSTTKKTSEIAKKPKKSVSKCLMLEESDETSPSFSPAKEINSLSNLKSKKSEDVDSNIKKSEDADLSSDDSASDLPLVKFKEKLKNVKDRVSKGNKRFIPLEDEKSSSSQTSDENLKISIKKTKHDKTKTVAKKRLLRIDDEDDDFISETNTSKMKKTEKNVKKKKQLIIEDDDEDGSSLSGVEKFTDQIESNTSFKGFHEKKEDRVLSSTEKYEKKKEKRVLPGTEKYEKNKEEGVLSGTEKSKEKKEERVLSLKEKVTDTKKETVLVEIQTENNIKKDEKNSRLKLRRSLSMKKSSDDLQEKSVILKDCSVNLIDTCKLKSENSSNINEEEVNKLESKVESKRKIVDDLKQAEIYKRLHNVENLRNLTATWKNGCISALNDLLPHLQEQSQSPKDMKTLLQNLGVPDNLITLLESGLS